VRAKAVASLHKSQRKPNATRGVAAVTVDPHGYSVHGMVNATSGSAVDGGRAFTFERGIADSFRSPLRVNKRRTEAAKEM
jgi:hypothetical protein